ncbi:hypothetical protein V1264_000648 [Littorina saxatilis]|uniref:Transposase Tc1-like domain-containing protein n=1 Tax=Littorina saxatilis TaxID=31220 RepID=A0AAN9C0F0_9CAEN
MPRLSPDQRQQAIERLDAGQSVQQVARAFGVNVTTVYRLQQRFHATNSTCDLPGRGRPRVTTARQDRHLVHQNQRDAFETTTNTARDTFGVHGKPVSARTVRRRLGGQNLVNRRPARRPVLTAQHRLDRLTWAQQHAHWRHRDWRRVLFSDEKRFCLEPGDGRVRIWRRPGQRFANIKILQHDLWGGASVMIWGTIGVNQRVGPVVFQNVGQCRGNGVNADRYINQVLRPYVVPFVQRHRNCLFQQDNARHHTARATQNFLRHNCVNLLPHPARFRISTQSNTLGTSYKEGLMPLPEDPAQQQSCVLAGPRCGLRSLSRKVITSSSPCTGGAPQSSTPREEQHAIDFQQSSNSVQWNMARHALIPIHFSVWFLYRSIRFLVIVNPK